MALNETALSHIYDQMNVLGDYHPSSMNIFGDWSIEPGDIVTLIENGASHVIPMMTSDINWNGAAMMDIGCSGNEEREQLSRQERNNYAYQDATNQILKSHGSRIGGAETNIKNQWTTIEKDEKHIALIASSEQLDELTKQNTTLFSKLNVEAGKISAVTTRTTKLEGKTQTLESKIEAIPGQITAAVSNGTSAASIVAKINDSGSSVTINADKIKLNGTTTISSLLTGSSSFSSVRTNSLTINSQGTFNIWGGKVGIYYVNDTSGNKIRVLGLGK